MLSPLSIIFIFLKEEFSTKPPAYFIASVREINGFTKKVPGFFTAPTTDIFLRDGLDTLR